MAAIFKIENRAPSMGDREAQWLVDNFPHEFENEDETVVGVRITRDNLSKFKHFKELGVRNGSTKLTTTDKHMISCVELMLGVSKEQWVDLLVWW